MYAAGWESFYGSDLASTHPKHISVHKACLVDPTITRKEVSLHNGALGPSLHVQVFQTSGLVSTKLSIASIGYGVNGTIQHVHGYFQLGKTKVSLTLICQPPPHTRDTMKLMALCVHVTVTPAILAITEMSFCC